MGIVIHAAVTLSSANLGAAGAFLVLDWLDLFFNWILFLVFAFAQWPVLRPQSRWQPPPGWPPWPATAPPGAGPVPPGIALGAPPEVVGAPPPAAPPSAAGPSTGWYRIPGSADEQVYWSGRAYTACRRWQDDGWRDVPVNFYSAPPPDPGDRHQ